MSTNTLKLVGAVAGSAMLAVGGVTAFATQAVAAPETPAAATVVSEQGAGNAATKAVTGQFAYTQDEVTPNGIISSVFRLASSAVCASMPEYTVLSNGAAWISVGGSAAGSSFEATVDGMAAEEDVQTYIMGCACSSNAAGGGAIVNAEVTGVSLESVAAIAGAR